MGFPYGGIRLPKAIVALTDHILYVRFTFVTTLAYLGLTNPVVPEQDDQDHEYSSLDLLSVAHPSPRDSLVTRKRRESIKERLPVSSYRDFLERNGGPRHGGATCAVCLSGVEKRQEVRELANCCHVFHKGCLDSWVDEGQVTCPLCRTLL